MQSNIVARAAVWWWRMASINDRVADRFLEHEVDLARFEEHLGDRALRVLKQLERDLVKELAGEDPTEPIRTTFQQARLKALLSQTRKTIATHYRDIAAEQRKELAELGSVESEFSREALNQIIDANVMTVSVPETSLAAIAGAATLVQGAPAAEWWKQQGSGLSDRFANQMRQGIARGETIDQLVRRIRGTKAKGYTDGIMALSRSQARALARTSAQAVSNEARRMTYEANEDVIRGIQHLSTLDGRTSPICIARSGSSWDLEGNPLPESPRQEPYPGPPPFHWQCRSVHIPLLKSLDEILGRKAATIKNNAHESTQSSMDGQVAGDLKYEDWLKGKPEAFQKKVLGKGKWELWQAGKLSLKDLIDQSGRPLTLAELRARTGVAPGELVPKRIISPEARAARQKAKAEKDAEAEAAYIRQRDVIVREWVHGSKRKTSVTVKLAMQAELGIGGVAYSRVKWNIDPAAVEAMRPVVRRMYEETQAALAQRRIDAITVYRGVKKRYPDGKDRRGTLESWSSSAEIELRFARGNPDNVKIEDVTRERIFLFRNGPGWKDGRFGNQEEFVVMADEPQGARK